MALSENLFPKLNRTFRKHRRKMGDISVWESIFSKSTRMGSIHTNKRSIWML
ncbi:unnamed protein product [Tenebrio molitor]|nr:unnamed protein product [Tenebrio molitor]